MINLIQENVGDVQGGEVEHRNVLNLLSRYKGLYEHILMDPESVEKDMISGEKTRYMVFPCDVIDLRYFFKNDYIYFKFPIVFFTYAFSEKYLKNNSIFLIFDAKRIPFENCSYGSVKVFFTDKLRIKDNLIKIILNSPFEEYVSDTVKKIISEFGIGSEFLISNNIPSLVKTYPKIAMKKKAQIEKDINLTSQEREIFNILINAKKEFNLNIEYRVAGGWVRDKLLGKGSDDIDIAVGIPGFELANYIYKFGKKYNLNVKEPYQVSLDKMSTPVIGEDKSSDLMVGSVKINGMKIEFVPMRTEHYPDPNSRQPVITTTQNPKEDVKRRDLTINALLYNIEKGEIEDYVGGKKDLLGGEIVLRTPDEARKTFMEDPLRMLRVLRFHSRYPNSVIDTSIIESMKDPLIQDSYNKKVSTERAGPEIVKMMMGDNPVESVGILFDTGLYKNVFKVPSMEDINKDGIHMDQQTKFHKYNLKDHTLEVIKNLNNIMKENNENDYMRGLLNIAALFHDFGKMKTQKPHPKEEGRMQYINHERVSSKMADEILKSIGVGRDERDIVNQIIRLHMRPHGASEWSDKARGRFLRETRMHGKEEKHKDLWKYVFYHAKADEMSSQPDEYDDEKIQKIYDDFYRYVYSPSGIFSKPILNGNEIIEIFEGIDNELTPDTGYIKEVLEIIKEKQDQNIIDMSFVLLPEGEERNLKMEEAKEQAIEEVKKIAPLIIKKYKEETKMSFNWFKKIKKSQTIPEGELYREDDLEIKKGPSLNDHKFYEGMRVRDRRKGMVNPQEFGVVDKVKGNKIKITWNPNNKKHKREQVFDAVEDTEILSFLVTEV